MVKTKLTIEFDNPEAAEHFGSWLCESGEQSYWHWMEVREGEEDGNITALDFNYHHPQDESFPEDDERRYANSKFLGPDENNPIITTTCGRLDVQK